ncbi:MAG: type 4a pilus biogenesis protein PilO [Microgenomates group bacterium]
MKFSPTRYTQDLKRYYRIPAVQSSLTVVLSFFVIAVFISFALRPTLVSIATLKTNIAESGKIAKILEAKVTNLQTAATQLEAIKPMLPTIDRSIPNNGVKYGDFINSIEAIAAQTGTKLDAESLGASLLFSRLVSPYNPDKDQSVLSLQFNVNTVGTYSQINEFLTLLLSMERIIAVESVNISPQSAKSGTTPNGSVPLKLEVTGQTFYLADQAQITKILEEKKGKK